MSFPAAAIANYFLDKGDSEERLITPLKLQKLVYYAHGWYLGIREKPLINEQVECWPYGPVVPSLYDAFKHLGNQAICERATGYYYDEDGHHYGEVCIDNCGVRGEEIEDVKAHLDEIWEAYSRFPATQLSNMTHLHGTPWREVYDQYGGRPPYHTDIPQGLIREHFKEKYSN